MLTMNYNEKQLQAINAKEANIIITAPPGSGKTASIVGAIEKYSSEHPMDKIVAITFTRKAAAELQNRVAALNTEISTIHSWSYRQLQILAGKYDFVIRLLDDDSIKDLLKRMCVARKQPYINQFQLFSFVMGNYNVDVDEKLKHTFELIRRQYIKFKRENNLYDFTDLPQYLLDMLIQHEESINDIDALFVDEFQDVDSTQLKIFDYVFAKKKVYIGDRKQSIYIFRGASEEAFDELIGFTDYVLDTNYRSYQEIMDYADTINRLAADALEAGLDYEFIAGYGIEDNYYSEVTCDRGYGGSVYRINDIGSCVEVIEDKPYSDVLLIKSLMKDKKTQILCRTNKQVKKIQSFGIDNVSTIHQAKGLEFDNVIMTDFLIDTEEERNVAYVGMTRAKNTLCLIKFEVLTYIICNEKIESNNKLF
jgi:DNA helicase-2/ATP-dependent DNA helicase PcrA